MYIYFQLIYSFDLKVLDIVYNFVFVVFLCSGIEMLFEIVRFIYEKRNRYLYVYLNFLLNIIKYIKYLINEDDDFI